MARDEEDLRAREQLLKELEQARAIFEKAYDGIGISKAGVIESYNPRLAEMLGYEPTELVGRHISTMVSQKEQAARPIRLAEMGAGKIVRGERQLIRKDGSLLSVDLTNSPLGEGRVLTIFRDVSERNQLREQLAQAQRLESVGRLAGGVAHDFNNLLTVVLNNADLLNKELSSQLPTKAADWLSGIIRAGERAAELTMHLLAFSRKQVVALESVPLDAVVRESERMLRRVIGEDIRLDVEPNAPGGHLLGDPGQLLQVVLNLAVNARDAMPGGGRLRIATELLKQAPALGSPHVYGEGKPAAPLGWAALHVEDAGAGMDESTAAHMFEPFFTTKPPGEGTGLGLAMVYGVVMQAEGRLRVTTEPTVGTSFSLYFPRAEPPPAAEQRGEGLPETPRGQPPQDILLVEDERAVADVVVAILGSQGYSVEVARQPEDALKARDAEAEARLVICDVVMPGMNGPELIAQLREREPQLGVLYISGYPEGALLSHRLAEDPRALFLPKPFNRQQLLAKLDELQLLLAKPT